MKNGDVKEIEIHENSQIKLVQCPHPKRRKKKGNKSVKVDTSNSCNEQYTGIEEKRGYPTTLAKLPLDRDTHIV